MKFKVGDKVKFIEEHGTYQERKGMRGTVVACSGKLIGIEFDDFINGHSCDGKGKMGYCVWRYETSVEPIPDNKIVITADGKTTLARLYDGKEVIKTATAKCAPSDTFDFATGANLAYDRLMRPEASDKPKEDKPEPVKLYCVDGWGTCLTKGKVYEATAGTFTFDNRTQSIYDWRKGIPEEWEDCLVPLVKRPAKVGEWIYITVPGDRRVKKGEIYQVVDDSYELFVKHPKGARATDNAANITPSKYLVLDGYDGRYEEQEQPKPKYYNGKVVCAGAIPEGVDFTVGKVYEYKDGIVTDNDGDPYNDGNPAKAEKEALNRVLVKFIPFVEG